MGKSETLLKKLNSALKPVTEEQDANAAVVLLLKSKGEYFDILLVKRAIRPGDVWSGQMAFPGGKREPYDQDLRATAIREMFEETGIAIKENQVLGVLNMVQSVPKRDFRILPFVAALDSEPKVRLNRDELDSYIWVSYERLIKSQGTSVEPGFGEVSAFLVESDVVWGITYKILTDFVKVVKKITAN